MDKRAFLAIVLSITILAVYSSILSKTQPPVSQEVASETSDYDFGSEQFHKTDSSLSQLQEAFLVKPEAKIAPEEYYTVDTDKFELTFSNPGGNLQEVYLKDYNVSMLGERFLAVEEFNNLPFSFEKQLNKVILSYNGQDEKIEKIFAFTPNSYLIEWTLVITNLTDRNKDYKLHIFNSHLDLSKLAKSASFQRRDLLEYSISLSDNILRKNVNSIDQKREIFKSDHVFWTGIRNNYFCSILKPFEPVKAYFTKPADKKQIITGIGLDCLAPVNSSFIFKADFYAGPQDMRILKSYSLGLEDIVSFGKLNPIAHIIIKILQFSHKVVPSWGFSIIFLSILISIVLYPFTFKSLKSMKEMQLLQPEIEKLRKTHKDQPQKLNREIMALYKEHKVNPLGGCLPLFLQMPIFISLYVALMRSIELRGASFLWIKDLSQPDRLFILPKSFPVIGNEINLLPLLMLGAMFVQQKMSSKSSPSSSAEQQKMMMIIMPIMFGFIFYHFPSGLTLYWTCYTIISIVMQRKLVAVKKS